MEYTTGSREGTMSELEREIMQEEQMEKVNMNNLVYDMFKAIKALVNKKNPLEILNKYGAFLHDPEEDIEEIRMLKKTSAIKLTKKFSKTELLNMASHLDIDANYWHSKLIIAGMLKDYADDIELE